jgi:hypothetical protein
MLPEAGTLPDWAPTCCSFAIPAVFLGPDSVLGLWFVTRTTNGKNFWCSQLTSFLCLQTDIFSLSVFVLESPRLTPFTLQLNQATFYPLSLSLSGHQSNKTCQPGHTASEMWLRTPAEPRSEAMVDMSLVVKLYP